MFGKHLAARGALEGLEARFAFDREGCGILALLANGQFLWTSLLYSQISAGSLVHLLWPSPIPSRYISVCPIGKLCPTRLNESYRIALPFLLSSVDC
jgi:hypothetical protein